MKTPLSSQVKRRGSVGHTPPAAHRESLKLATDDAVASVHANRGICVFIVHPALHNYVHVCTRKYSKVDFHSNHDHHTGHVLTLSSIAEL